MEDFGSIPGAAPDLPRVVDFIELNGLDESAAGALQALDKMALDCVMDMPPSGFHIQGVDAARGTPSSLVMGRVRKAATMTPEQIQRGGAATEANIQSRMKFYTQLNNLDDRCEQALLAMGPEGAALVMDHGFIVRGVDPKKGTASQLAMARIKRVQRRLAAGGAPVPMGAGGPPGGNKFRGAPSRAAAPQMVQDYGRPPAHSGSRMVIEGYGVGPDAPPEFFGRPRRLDDFIELNQLDDRCAQALKELSPAAASWVMDCGHFVFVDHVEPERGNTSTIAMSRLKKLRNISAAEREQYPSALTVRRRAEEFVRVNNLDERSVEVLSSLDPLQVQAVMDEGFVVRNVDESKGTASGLVMARVKKVRMNMASKGMGRGNFAQAPGGRRRSRSRGSRFPPRSAPFQGGYAPDFQGGAGRAAPASRLEQFIEVNSLDQRCADRLRSLDPVQQQVVMDMGFVVGNVKRDRGSASSVVMGRIRKTTDDGTGAGIAASAAGIGAYLTPDVVATRLEDFIKINNLDERCQLSLRELNPEQQAAIMDRAFVITGIDPVRGSASSMVMGECRKFRMQAEQNGGGAAPPQRTEQIPGPQTVGLLFEG
mmetsp:Transcript_31403/g.68797  ORF Transcript_31403/g.68797 Transcript_31403/m.68797 type:complete len:596 (+) Transcript_31403:72-1859(+)|eukprot:CAMPEP_0204390170 /NCGR_PEP_ID=MMETSP0469-20131031/60535_1 /ASSEMBLY_ACC=CAM_ASM_000384 /TAXON_ID=2969 /ORGANISM="Oxyrrhis marina" /LENGTH=595 /DNA_ID=CAMNT_0051383981 /DNA_START=49 /DNA_END=1836 /DNA_ORIENTATION=+